MVQRRRPVPKAAPAIKRRTTHQGASRRSRGIRVTLRDADCRSFDGDKRDGRPGLDFGSPTARRSGQGRHPSFGAILLEQNDEWSVQRSPDMTLETITGSSDVPLVSFPAMTA